MDGVVIDSDVKIEDGARQIVESAISSGATDIHIEPRDKTVVIRYRRGGNLHIASKLPKNTAQAVANHFKQLAGLEIEQVKAPQNGDYELKLGRASYILEISTLPVLDGEKLTIHIVELTSSLPGLSDLGFWGSGLDKLQRSLSQTNGLVLIGGRGRVSALTLMALIESLPLTSKAAYISEVDEPLLPARVKKVLAKPAGRIGIESHLDRLTKQDVDVVGISSLHSQVDVAAALEVSKKSLTLAGIPTFGAVKSLTYLNKITGPDIHLQVRAAVGEIMVRQLCPKCRENYEPSAMDQVKLQKLLHINNSKVMKKVHELEKLAASAGISKEIPITSSDNNIVLLWHSKKGGCKSCNHTGFNGSVGVTEVCLSSDELLQLLPKRTDLSNLQKQAIEDGMVDLPTDALVKALRGLIDSDTLFDICSQYGL